MEEERPQGRRDETDRGSRGDGTASGGSREETGGSSGESPTEEERARAVMDELRRLRVEELALDMAVNLVTVGYQKLGLTERTRELRDLREARLSIELLRACLDVLERERPSLALGDLRGTLAAMQLSFARAVDDERAAAGVDRGAAKERPAAGAGQAASDQGPTGSGSAKKTGPAAKKTGPTTKKTGAATKKTGLTTKKTGAATKKTGAATKPGAAPRTRRGESGRALGGSPD